MKSIGRNFTALFIAVIFTMACIAPAFAEAGNVSLIPDVRNKSVSILGQLANEGGVNYIVNITGFSEDVVVFSDSNPPIDSRLFTTYQGGYIGKEADKGETIYFADTFAPGHYNLYIHYNENGENKRIIRSFFVINPDDTLTQTLLLNLNQAATKGQFTGYLKATGALAMVGIYDAEIASSGDFPLEHAFYVRPAGGYDVTSLQSAINDGDVIYTIKTNGVEALTKNTILLGEAYTGEYQTMSAYEKNTLNQLLQNADYTADTLPNVFTDMAITAKVKCCTNLTDMEEAVKTRLAKLAINMGSGSNYNNISSTRKYMVFERMVNERANFVSMADIKSSFEKHSADVLSEESMLGGGMGSQGSAGSGGGPSGGSQSSSGNILNPGNVPSASKIFNDINGHFAASDIEKLAKLQIINGNPDGSFRPYSYITRAEFSKLVAVMFDITGGYSLFSDVAEAEWFAPFVNALASKEIITGYNGLFNPNDNIKREDAVLMLQRAGKLFSLTSGGNSAVSFADEAQISPYAKEAVTEFSKMGIVNGDGVNFNPLQPITRGEVAAVLSRLYNIYVGKGA